MTALRRRLHTVAFIWLLCQAASLSAFVPGECCKAHAAEAAAKAKKASCHESAPTSAEAAADKPGTPQEGDACPMHRGSRSHDCCTISNGCDGPGRQLTTLFAYIGVVQAPQSASIVLESTAAVISPDAPLLYHLTVPDAPPPRV
jgi:hypothetical protein